MLNPKVEGYSEKSFFNKVDFPEPEGPEITKILAAVCMFKVYSTNKKKKEDLFFFSIQFRRPVFFFFFWQTFRILFIPSRRKMSDQRLDVHNKDTFSYFTHVSFLNE